MPSSAFTKFESFSEKVGQGLFDFRAAGDTLRVYLSNATPNVSTHDEKADIAEISAGFGYSAGGVDTENDQSRAGGVTSVTGVDKQIAASGGNIGPFRYAILYDDSIAGDPLIGYWDYGSSITVQDGETFDLDFGASMFTIT